MSLVATIHFSPFTCCFRRFFRRSFTGSFRNENAEFTQSLLCSRFTTFTGECNHSHVHSLFTANGSSECSSIHVSIGDTKATQFIENKQTKRSGKGGRITMRCRGFIPITITRMITIHFLPLTANGSLITPITFTYSLQSRELWPLST